MSLSDLGRRPSCPTFACSLCWWGSPDLSRKMQGDPGGWKAANAALLRPIAGKIRRITQLLGPSDRQAIALRESRQRCPAQARRAAGRGGHDPDAIARVRSCTPSGLFRKVRAFVVAGETRSVAAVADLRISQAEADFERLWRQVPISGTYRAPEPKAGTTQSTEHGSDQSFRRPRSWNGRISWRFIGFGEYVFVKRNT